MFNEKGYHATSIQLLADALGFTKAALYHYFPSKEALLVEVVASIGNRLRDQLAEIITLRSSPEDQLRRWLRGHIELVLSARNVFRVYLRERNALSEPSARTLHEGEHDYFVAVIGMIEEGIAEGAFRSVDARSAAATLIGAANWTIEWVRPSASHASVASEVADVLLGGLVQRSSRRQSPTPKK